MYGYGEENEFDDFGDRKVPKAAAHDHDDQSDFDNEGGPAEDEDEKQLLSSICSKHGLD
jgi:hypothetical protein